jgi:flagellar motor switch protein FliN/FliY
MDANQLVPSDFETTADSFPADPAEGASPAASGMEAVYDIPVKVQAVLGGARMPINELLQMRGGTVIELDRRVGEPVDVLVNDRLIARGELVLIDGALGVTLTEIVKAER